MVSRRSKKLILVITRCCFLQANFCAFWQGIYNQFLRFLQKRSMIRLTAMLEKSTYQKLFWWFQFCSTLLNSQLVENNKKNGLNLIFFEHRCWAAMLRKTLTFGRAANIIKTHDIFETKIMSRVTAMLEKSTYLKLFWWV